jgi:hypothetical protein
MRKILTAEFKEAVQDYFYLLERGFSQKSVLKLVGDRYRLDRIQRNLLFRGVTRQREAKDRKARITKRIKKLEVSIDSYNIFLTVANYILGRPLYIANDGFLRDAGEVYRKALERENLHQAVDLVFSFLKKEKPAGAWFFVDSPVAFSGELAVHLRSLLDRFDLPGIVELVRSPDFYLKQIDSGIIATSDSIIIAKTRAPVIDLARRVIETEFSPSFIRLDRFV